MDFFEYVTQKFPKIAQLKKSDEIYELYDLPFGDLTLSRTRLHLGQHTNGHVHMESGKTEVYQIISGSGLMQLCLVGGEKVQVPFEAPFNAPDQEPFPVKAGEIITVPVGYFHRLINTGDCDLIAFCTFPGGRNH